MIKKRAVIAVEVAIITPLLFIIFLGIMEYGWYFFVKQTAQYASTSGARVGCLRTSTDIDVAKAVDKAMKWIPHDPPKITRDQSDCSIRVRVVVPSVSITGAIFSDEEEVVGETLRYLEGCG